MAFVYDAAAVDERRLQASWQALLARRPELGRTIQETQVAAGDPEQATEEALAAQDAEGASAMLVTLLRSGLGAPVRLVVSFGLMGFDAAAIRIVMGEWQCLYEKGFCRPLGVSSAVISELWTAPTESDQRYWDAEIARLPAGPDLTWRAPLGSLGPSRMERVTVRVGLEVLATIRQLAEALGASPESLFTALFAETLARWTNDESFSLTLLSSTRDLNPAATHGVVANLSRLLVAPYDRAPMTFGERVLALHARITAAKAHWSVDGQAVLRRLAKARREPGMILPVAVSVNLGDGPGAIPAQWPGTLMRGSLATPFVALDHQVLQTSDGLEIGFDFVPAALDRATVAGMAESYERLMRTASKDLDQRSPAAIPTRDAAVQAAANATTAPIPAQKLHAAALQSFTIHAARPAVITTARTLTYARLDRESALLAASLAACGVGPEQVVAIQLEKGWEQIVACFAILRLGAAYLPLDPTHPQERIRGILAAAGASAVVGRGLSVERVGPEQPATAPVADLAYVIFTSGSTGAPKGVMIDHRGAYNTVSDIDERFSVTAADRSLALSQLNFDLSVFDIFGLLGRGGALVIPTGDEMVCPAAWLRLAHEHGVTIWNSVPSLFGLACRQAASAGATFPNSLRLALLSGDWIPLDLPPQASALAKRLELVGLGGATEASIWSNFHCIDRVDPEWKSIPYGRPLRNQRFHVVDAHLARQPLGVVGELVIGGIGVAKGYINDPERTARSFVTCPKTGETLYKTGDLGRYLPNGDLEFLGRKDFQVKVNGYRVELEEIDAKALESGCVGAAISTVVGDRFDAKHLVLFATPKAGGVVDRRALLDFLASRLPPYMVPRQTIELDAIPLTANGKVDRKALAALAETHKESDCAAAARESEPLCALGRLWAKSLGALVFDPDASYFSLGGDSLGAINMLVELERRTGRAVHLSQLLRAPTFNGFRASLGLSAGALVPLRKEAAARRVAILVHPVSGQVACYRGLADRLAGFDIYALQRAEDDGSFVTVESLAASYADDVCAALAPQTVSLGGWSFGGVIASALAAVLEARGFKVERLVIIDATLTRTVSTDASPTAELRKFLADFGVERAKLSDEVLERALSGDPESLFKRVAALGLLASLALDPDWLAGVFDVFRSNLRALHAYRPQAQLAVQTELVWAGRESHIATGEADWRAHLTSVAETTLAADHESIVRDPACMAAIAALFQKEVSL